VIARGKVDIGFSIPIVGANVFINKPMNIKNDMLNPTEYNKLSTSPSLCNFKILRIKTPGIYNK
jgi:hypothetical protein